MPGTDQPSYCVDLLKRLATMDYEGAITLAPHPSQIESMRRDAAIQKAEELIDDLLAAAGLDKRGRVDESIGEATEEEPQLEADEASATS